MKKIAEAIIKRIDNASERQAWLYVIAIYVAFVLIRSAHAMSIKIICRYWDELLYYDFAKSLLKTGLFSVRGAFFESTAVGYSISITPVVFAFQDSPYVIPAVCVWNAFMICSSAFPIYLLTKKMVKKRSIQMVVLVLSLSLPIFSINLNVLAENLFIPLSFWTYLIVYNFFENGEQRKKGQTLDAVLIGLLLVVLYITKTLAGVVILAYGTTCILRTIQTGILGNNKEVVYNNILNTVVSGASFICFYIVAVRVIDKLTIEGGSSTGNAVGSVFSNSLTHLTCLEEYGYFIYAIIMPLGIAVISMGLYPVILPLCDHSNMSKSTVDYMFFSELLLVYNSIVVAFTIIIVETPFDATPVHHYRYCEHLTVNFLILAAVVVEGWIDNKEEHIGRKYKRRVLSWTGVFSAIILTTFRFCNNGPKWENYGLGLLYRIDNRFSNIEEVLNISASTILFRIAVVLAAVVVTILLLYKKSRRIAISLILLTIAIYNWNTNAIFTNTYVAIINNIPSTQLDDDMVRMDDYLEELDGNVLIVKGQEFSAESCVFDTFIFSTDYQTTQEQLALTAGNDFVVDLDVEPIYTTRWVGLAAYKNLKTVDYIVSDVPELLDEKSANLVSVEGVSDLFLYKMKDNKKLILGFNEGR